MVMLGGTWYLRQTWSYYNKQTLSVERIECSRILFEDFLFYGILNLQDGFEN